MTIFICVINFCLYVGLLQFCRVFLFLLLLFYFLILIYKIFKLLLFLILLFICFLFLLFFPPCSSSLIYVNLIYFYFTLHFYSFFLFLTKFVSFVFVALFPSWYFDLVLFSSLCFSHFCF